SFSLAVDTEGEEDALTTTWVRVTYFGEYAESLVDRLQKGVEVYCEGRLKLDTWAAKDGVRRSGLSIVPWQTYPWGKSARSGQRLPIRGDPERQPPLCSHPTMRSPSRRMESGAGGRMDDKTAGG